MASFVSLSKHLLGETKAPVMEQPAPPPVEVDRAAAERERAHRAALESLAHAEADARAAAALLRESARSLTEMRKVLVAEVRSATAAVILEASRRIAGDALHADPRLLEAIVEQAARSLGKGGLVVRVNPVDAAIVRDVFGPTGVEIVEDFNIEGGCICEGPSGLIDASVEGAVAAVAAVLDQWK